MKMLARLAVFGAALALAFPVHAEPTKSPRWVGAWASAQMAPDEKNRLAAEDYPDATLRQIEVIAEQAGDVRLAVLEACGHSPHRDQAAQVLREIKQFLVQLNAG